MIINDAHIHISSGLETYDLDCSYKNIIYNYIEEYKKESDKYRDGKTHHSLIFDFRSEDNIRYLLNEIETDRVNAVKIHSRIQQIQDDDYTKLLSKIKILPSEIPIIFDAFYDGPEIKYQPSIYALSRFIEQLPRHKIIIAHSGGYEMLKYFFHFRTIKNIYFELSLSLYYLQDSSVRKDILKLLTYLDKNRILFGSDFPYAPATKQQSILLDYCKDVCLTKEEQNLIFFKNYFDIFTK